MELKSSKTRNVESYMQIHRTDRGYGKTSEELISQIIRYSKNLNVKTVLDFGCGKSNTVDVVCRSLMCASFKYDPAIPEYAELPVIRADLVINTDVLEHLDVDEVDLLLRDISSISRNAFFNISTRPAMKLLPNGENAHATVRNRSWWEEKLKEFFSEVKSIPSYPDEARFITWRPSKSAISAEWWEGLRYSALWAIKRFRYLIKRIVNLV